jgi:cytochrome c553
VIRALAAMLLAPALAGAQALPERVKLCESCHGAGGNSTLEKTPSIAAQPVTYLENQLVYFREDLRNAPAMQAVVKGMKDEEITALAKHFAAQKAVVVAPRADAAAAEKGKALADKMHCGQCHLPAFQGRDQMPRLAAQREDYLLAAMIGYRDGTRTGADTTMTEVLYNVRDDDLKALATYLSQLRD